MTRVARSEHWVVVGFGEAAHGLMVSGFLKSDPPTVCLPTGRAPSAETRRRLLDCGLTHTADPAAVQTATVVLSMVTPDAALDAARTVAPFLRPGTLYVDFNSIAGTTAAAIADVVEDRGARFIDAAVMGPVPLMGLAVPIWLSGAHAPDFHTLAKTHGLATTVLSSRPGDASSLKMLWSVMTKGTIALLAEALTGAHRLGLLDPLLELLGREYGNTGSTAMVLRMLRSTAVSGTRRLQEMDEARKTLDAAAVPSWTVDAAIRWIATLAAMPAIAREKTVPEVVKALSDALREARDVSPTRSP